MQFFTNMKVIIIIKEIKVKLIWRNSIRKRYEALGYKFTNYGDEFDVDINDIPKRSEIKITGICEYCGKEKEMTMSAYNSVTKDGTKKYRCRECYKKQKLLKYEDVLRDIDELGYKILTTEKEYVNSDTRIRYICPIHGEKEMRASNLHAGKKCPECGRISARKIFAFSSDEVYSKVDKLGGKLLNKDDYINQDIKNLKILCPRCHKNILITSLKHFRQHGGQACSECYRKESVGERRIRQWLETNNIDFIQEKWFEDCRDVNPLPFDFYLPDKNIIIEFDGQQHFEETHFFSLRNSEIPVTEYVQYHDAIKTDYCNSHGINLIRIPYTQIKEIENILQEKIA